MCDPNPLKFKENLDLDFSVFVGGQGDSKHPLQEQVIQSTITYEEMITDQDTKTCIKSARIVKDQNGEPNVLTNLINIDGDKKVEVNPSAFTSDQEVFLELTS
jgi:hypothetical protein